MSTNTTLPLPPMNTDWFRQQLATRKLSQRGLAKLLDLDPAAVSLMLRGQRRMTNEEAHRISGILGAQITEVLRQAGIEVNDDIRRVRVTGYIDCDFYVNLFPRRTYDKVVGPADCPEGTYALQMRCPSSPEDGWMMFISPAEGDPKDHMGQLCCVALEDGKHSVAHLTRGYRSGSFNLVSQRGAAMLTDVKIVWASPVLWIKPV